LKPGDRVRLTVVQRMRGYQPGDKGMVLRELAAGSNGTLYFLVKMDKDDPSKTGGVFTDDEIEPDV
jgi:hypothetical protein